MSDPVVSVTQALQGRRSVRAFLDTPVPIALLRTLLATASRAPSGGNLQPWSVYLVSGGALARLVEATAVRLDAAPKGDGAEYDIYPPKLTAPYTDRRFQVGEALYGHLDIAREDRDGRRRWFAENYRFFGAPVGLFCYVDRMMGPPQWSDLGMFLQSFMLLLIEHGLASCPQECWALYPQTISRIVGAPDELMLFTGMSIGYEDVSAPANQLRSDRASVDEFATFLDA